MLNRLSFFIFSSVSFVSLYQTKAQQSGFCLELRSKGAERGMPSPAGRYTRSGLCDEVVGVGFCPQTAFGREPVGRRLAKCDAGSFVGTSSISLAPPQAAGLVHSAAPPLKIAIALLDCDFVLCMSVQRGLFLPRRTHTRCRGRKPHTAVTRASRRRTVPAAEGCKDANRSRRYPLTLLLRQAPEPLVGAALRKNAEISLCDFQRPL